MALHNLDTELVTVTEWKTWASVDNSSKDEQIAGLVTQVSAAISQYCGRKFAEDDYTETYSGKGTPTLWLRNWPITSPIVSPGGIWMDSGRQWTAGTKLVEYTTDGNSTTGDYVIVDGGIEEAQGRVVRESGVWSRGISNIRAVYTGGYATIPAPVKHAALRWMSHYYEIVEGGWQSKTSESIAVGGGSVAIVVHKIPADVAEILNAWRRVGVR